LGGGGPTECRGFCIRYGEGAASVTGGFSLWNNRFETKIDSVTGEMLSFKMHGHEFPDFVKRVNEFVTKPDLF
jgi:hypothetical protein